MNLIEYLDSLGWKFVETLFGRRWFHPDMHPLQNTLTDEQLFRALMTDATDEKHFAR